jgi:hypothetical protein
VTTARHAHPDAWPHYKPVTTVVDVLETGACYEGVRDYAYLRKRISGATEKHLKVERVSSAAHADGYGSGYGYGYGYGDGDGDGGDGGDGSGSGSGYGGGYGDEYADGYGYGDRYGDGYGYEYGYGS